MSENSGINSFNFLRVCSFQTLNIEGAVINNPQIPPANWPNNGAITFKQYKMRYSDTQPTVIKGISLSIQAREKIGIVGNSGSGSFPGFYFFPSHTIYFFLIL